VLDNVMTGALGRLDKGIDLISSTLGIFNKKEREKAMELLKFVGIEDKAFERVDRLRRRSETESCNCKGIDAGS